MLLATVIFGGATAVVAVGGLGFRVWRGVQQQRLERQAAELAQQSAAIQARQAELALQGRPTTTGPARREPGPDRAYRFEVKNVGQCAVTHLRPELVDSSNRVCSEEDLENNVFELDPQASRVFVLKVAEPGNQNPLHLRYSWFDEMGGNFIPRNHRSNITIPEA